MSDQIPYWHLSRLSERKELLEKELGAVVYYDHMQSDYFILMTQIKPKSCERIGTIHDIRKQLEAAGVKV